MKEKILDLARSQIGYSEESGNRTKYAKYFDTEAWQWFNTKKQGTEWCAIFICWLFCQVMGPQAALVFLGCPSPKNNCAAGVKFLREYMITKGYKVDKKTGQPGDVIFLNSNKHVGIMNACLRLRMMNENVKIRVESEEKTGTMIEIRIPNESLES